jgi:hypothetical protein
MAWPDFAYDIHEDFEDVNLATGLTESDATAEFDFPDSAQFYMGANSASDSLDNGEAYIWFEAPDSFSYGFWFRTGTYGNWAGGPWIIRLLDTVGGSLYRIIDEDNTGSSANQFRSLEDQDVIARSNATWYWITGKLVRNGTCLLRVYDTAHNQVGAEMSYAMPNTEFGRLQIGSSVAFANASIVYFDAFVVDTTDATYPLFGWETAGGGSKVPLIMAQMNQFGGGVRW